MADTTTKCDTEEFANAVNKAAAVGKNLEHHISRDPINRTPVLGLEDDVNAQGEAVRTFVHQKESRVAKRKWKKEQEEKGNIPKDEGSGISKIAGMIIVLCSTAGMLLFGYRMYLTHWALPKQYPLYSTDQLAKHNSQSSSPWIAILGEVYDVSKSLHYYGKKGSYNFFTGKDCSRSFVTGDFTNDLNDNVTDFKPSQMAGLVHWKGFFYKEYTYKGRVKGSFFGETGTPTEQLRAVLRAASEHKAAEKERANKRLSYPTCNTRWSSKAGSEVWCDDDMYPRLLTEMVSGKAEERCACFEQKGWSNLRKIYPGCPPSSSRCTLPAPKEPQQKTPGSEERKATSSQASSENKPSHKELGSTLHEEL